MKVLVNRCWGYITSRLVIHAIAYEWCVVRREVGVVTTLCRFLRIPVPKFIPNIRRFLYQLSAENLRRFIRLADILCCHPDMFNRVVSCFRSVPLSRLETIIILDREWFQPFSPEHLPPQSKGYKPRRR
jgi:hypothetical protein